MSDVNLRSAMALEAPTSDLDLALSRSPSAGNALMASSSEAQAGAVRLKSYV